MILLTDIQFVIVLYKCKLQDSPTYISLSSILEKNNESHRLDLFIYDNSPYIQNDIPSAQYWNIIYKSDLSNSGLSIAYNEAAAYARKTDKKYILLLDQDTSFPLNSLDIYIEYINKNKDIDLFAPILKIQNGKIMSPCKYVKKWGRLIDNIPTGIHNLDEYVPVNSGLCINLKQFFLAGTYNENVKVDGADFQFIERYKKNVSNFFYVLNLEIEQNFSLFDTDLNNILSRFRIFLTDVKNFERKGFEDQYYYGRIALIRTIKLLLQTKKRVILDYYIKFYLKSR